MRAVYDHYSRVVRYDAGELWDGVIPAYTRYHGLPETQSLTEKSLGLRRLPCLALHSRRASVEQLQELRLIGRSDGRRQVSPTPPNEIEFMVRLRRLRRGAPPRAIAGELVPTNTRPDWLDPAGRAGSRRWSAGAALQGGLTGGAAEGRARPRWRARR